MESLVNEKTTFSQAAIKWALTDPSLDSVLISIRTFEHVDEYCRASGQSLTSADEAVLGKYETAVNNQFCRIGCTTCHGTAGPNAPFHGLRRSARGHCSLRRCGQLL